MHDELTKQDIALMQKELDELTQHVLPAAIEEVKRTRAFGDLSENYEYKAAKQAQNHARSRIRYLSGMISTAHVIADRSGEDEVGLFDKVEIYMPEDDETQVIQIVTTVRCDPSKGFISKESPFGKAVLGHRVGDSVMIEVSSDYSYEAVIRSITKGEDDGKATLMRY
ncbi:MAG: GreA/GreB family elongation factor [Oscillospiraceae bacterium]|nr:GreA/GreB family elongation factor [Oscillospiraceae bacterium]